MSHDEDEIGIPEALQTIARQLSNLGVGNAMTQMGAIEMLAMEVRDGTTRIADALHEIAEAQRSIADAIASRAEHAE